MTTDATENHDAARRDGSGLERGVRPAAWKRKGGDLRGVSYFPMENGDEPLYDQAALDAAVAAERERCARPMEEAAARLLAPKRTNEVDRHVAEILQRHAARIRGA